MDDEFFIPQLVKHIGGKKVMWSFVFNGRRCVLTTHQLMTQSEFRKTVMEKSTVSRQGAPRSTLRGYIGNLMRNCVEQENAGPD